MTIVSVFRVDKIQYVTVSNNGMLSLVMGVFDGRLPHSTGTISSTAGAEAAALPSAWFPCGAFG
jgi:hypothetical protein